MPNKNGNQAVDVDEKQEAAAVDHKPSVPASNEKSTTSRKRVFLISGVLLAVIACGYFAWNAFRYGEDTDDAQVDGHVMPLSARIDGHIKDVYVIEGQIVHAGDALVTIDPQGLPDRGRSGTSESGRCGSYSRELPLEGADYFRNRSKQFGFGQNWRDQRGSRF